MDRSRRLPFVHRRASLWKSSTAAIICREWIVILDCPNESGNGLSGRAHDDPGVATRQGTSLGQAIAWVLVSMMIGSLSCSNSDEPKTSESGFVLPPYAFHPTGTTVVISAMPASDLELRVRFGTSSSRLDRATDPSDTKAGVRYQTTLHELLPGSLYHYEVQGRALRGDEGSDFGEWLPGVIKSFRTARERGDLPWSFVVGGDDHSVVAYARSDCETPGHADYGILAAFHQTQKNMLSREADFYLNAGDTSNNHGFVPSGCSFNGRDLGAGTIGFEGDGSAFSQATARWGTWIHNNRFVLTRLPVFLAMGNHDGEQSWGNAEGDCRYMRNNASIGDTHVSSEAARLAMMPNPADTYSGHRSGAYYSFVWGDVEIFVLEPHKFGVSGPGAPFDGSHSFPEDANDWTLGSKQLTWLATRLRSSDRKWKLLISHHLLGGITGDNCYHYGRGSVGSTDTGNAKGKFLGEQAKIQSLMEETGAQAFLFGHDHIALAAEKLHNDGSGSGVHYITVGMLGFETPPAWATAAYFVENSDVNGDGVADYEPGDIDHGTPRDHASMEKGHFRATVNESHIEFCYYRSVHRNPAENNKLDFCYRVEAGAGRNH
jgi:phosphodiesterase/alkaline phosphatase D-like protein